MSAKCNLQQCLADSPFLLFLCETGLLGISSSRESCFYCFKHIFYTLFMLGKCLAFSVGHRLLLKEQERIYVLTLRQHWVKFSAEDNLKYFSYSSKKTGLDISCKLSLMETICMKCQILFFWKNKKNITNLSSADTAKRILKACAETADIMHYRYLNNSNQNGPPDKT